MSEPAQPAVPRKRGELADPQSPARAAAARPPDQLAAARPPDQLAAARQPDRLADPRPPASTGRQPSKPSLPPGPYLVVGLARSGVAAASALRRRGLPVIGVDQGEVPLAQRLEEEGVEVHQRSAGVELLDRVGSVIKSPGVPQQAPVIAEARARALPVIGELELGYRLIENEIVAVTGTNGKTTTVELIAHIHRQARLPVAVAGNIGLALCALVDRIPAEVVVICEVSSFQLQDCTHFAPQAAALLNLQSDHLDRHRSIEDYIAAKLRLFAHQRDTDIAVLPTAPGVIDAEQLHRKLIEQAGGSSDRQLAESEDRAACEAPAITRAVLFGEGDQAALRIVKGKLAWHGEHVLAAEDMQITGAHNLANAAAAAAICLARGVPLQAVAAGLQSFAGVEHRLERARELQGVAFVNDSKATNVASTLVALSALRGGEDPEESAKASLPDDAVSGPDAVSEEGRGRQAAPARRRAGDSPAQRHIHLILGGQGKGQDFTALRAAIDRACSAVYLIGEDEDLIAQALEGIETPVERCGDLATAITQATVRARLQIASRRWVQAAQAGPAAARQTQPALAPEVVLLSPACASFDQFESFEARGKRFKELVVAL